MWNVAHLDSTTRRIRSARSYLDDFRSYTVPLDSGYPSTVYIRTLTNALADFFLWPTTVEHAPNPKDCSKDQPLSSGFRTKLGSPKVKQNSNLLSLENVLSNIYSLLHEAPIWYPWDVLRIVLRLCLCVFLELRQGQRIKIAWPQGGAARGIPATWREPDLKE